MIATRRTGATSVSFRKPNSRSQIICMPLESTSGRKVLFSSLLEPNETAAAIVAIVVILERRVRSAPPMTRENDLVIVTL